jgi:hypothetical protein
MLTPLFSDETRANDNDNTSSKTAKMDENMDKVRPNNALDLAAFVTNHHDTYPFITPSGGELSGNSILITSSSKGIGRVIAARCAKARCANLAVAARSSLEAVMADIEREARSSGLKPLQILPLEMGHIR